MTDMEATPLVHDPIKSEVAAIPIQTMQDLLRKQGIAWSGPSLEMGPLPAFFYFALSGEESLHLDSYCQPVHFLEESLIRCYSLTLPYHGPGLDNATAMDRWVEALDSGEDFLTPFLQSAKAAVDMLCSYRLIDTNHLYVGGLSRGGFIALHLAAQDPRFKAILAFAPLTAIHKLSCLPLVDQLISPKVRFYIGNRDQRVSTDSTYNLVRAITEAKYAKGQRSPEVEMIISPSIGHKGHGTSPQVFKEGANWIRQLLI